MIAVLDCYLSQALSSIPLTAFILVYHFAHPVPKRRTMPTRKTEKLCCLSSRCICFHGVGWIWSIGFCVDAHVLICEHEQNLMLACPMPRRATALRRAGGYGVAGQHFYTPLIYLSL
jgi:hypothetical protein